MTTMASGMSVWHNKCAVGPAMDMDLLQDILPHSFSHGALSRHQCDFMAPLGPVTCAPRASLSFAMANRSVL